jgi:hypothetical protein
VSPADWPLLIAITVVSFTGALAWRWVKRLLAKPSSIDQCDDCGRSDGTHDMEIEH